MKIRTFKRGGIFPPDNKHLTNKSPIKEILPEPGEYMRFPLKQHIGEACQPIVKTGDRVLVGQKIADSKVSLSAPIHSSVSGRVMGFTETLTPTGEVHDAIVVENDGLYEEIFGISGEYDIPGLLREAGIVGLGGAGFPTHIKLDPPYPERINYIIINGAECEPFLTTDHRLLLEEHKKIIEGIKIILQLFPKAKGIVAIENNKPDAVNIFKKACTNERRIFTAVLKTKYPQGSEKHLITACTGRKVPEGGLPRDIGCIVHNTDTVIAVERAVNGRKPLTHRVVTVSGAAVKNPGNYKVPLGISFEALIEAIGGFKENPAKLIFGGPMMGIALEELDIPVIKTSSALICFTKKEAEIPPEKSCIRCGKCLKHCPMGLIPLMLSKQKPSKKIISNCIKCGSCAYICPAKREVRYAK